MADLSVFITERLTAGGFFVVVVPPLDAAAVFLTTVPVLASLDSLVWLIFLLPRVDPVADADVAAGFLALEAVPVVLELVVAFRVPVVAPRVDLAFWTILEIRLEEVFVPMALEGDAGLAIMDLAGEAALSAPRGRTRALVSAGERICPGMLCGTSAVVAAVAPRTFFFGMTVGSTEFSLSSYPFLVRLHYN